MRLCPLHGPVHSHSATCPRFDCGLPLLRLDGGTDAPQVWKWETSAGRPEIRAPRAAAERYAREIAALAAEGFADAEIVEWFRPLGVGLSEAEVEAALAAGHTR